MEAKLCTDCAETGPRQERAYAIPDHVNCTHHLRKTRDVLSNPQDTGLAWAPGPQHSGPLFLRGEDRTHWRPSLEGGPQGSEEKQDQYSTKARRINTNRAFLDLLLLRASVPPTVCRLFLGECTVHKKNVRPSRSGSPCLKQVPAKLFPQGQRHKPVTTVTSLKLAEAPQIPGVTNCVHSLLCLFRTWDQVKQQCPQGKA